jgi:predicted esterase
MSWLARALLLSSTVARASVGGGCKSVQPDECGTDWWDSCLKCSTSKAYDCEECCAGCTRVAKSGAHYCECGAPSPPPGADTWARYTIDGMDVLSVTGGRNATYRAAVILLHGGGGEGDDWRYQYEAGWLGNLSGLKYVFPTSRYPSHVWFHTFKNGCGLDDDCAYNRSSIGEAAGWVEALVAHEAALLGGATEHVHLGGFSEGGQLAGYLQLAQLRFALGSTIIMDSFPLPPLFDWQDAAAARRGASYAGADMRWMIWHGAADPIFPVQLTLAAWNRTLGLLGVREAVLRVEHVEPGMAHTLVRPELAELVRFVRSG